jgi:hypothetical protein
MEQDIAEVRQGLLIQADRRIVLHSEPACLTPHESFDRLQATRDPANQHLLIITVSWSFSQTLDSSFNKNSELSSKNFCLASSGVIDQTSCVLGQSERLDQKLGTVSNLNDI